MTGPTWIKVHVHAEHPSFDRFSLSAWECLGYPPHTRQRWIYTLHPVRIPPPPQPGLSRIANMLLTAGQLLVRAATDTDRMNFKGGL